MKNEFLKRSLPINFQSQQENQAYLNQFKIFNKDYIYVGYLNQSQNPQGPGQLYQFEQPQTQINLTIFIEAQFVNGFISAEDCIIIRKDSSYYRGGFHYGTLNGYGKLVINQKLTLIGNFVWGSLEGKGKANYPDGASYQGNFLQGKKQGKGKMIWKFQQNKQGLLPRSIIYEGFFKENKMNGLGYLKSPNYEYWGPFCNNMKEGKGTIKFSDGKKFEGWFQKDEINGYGQLHHPNGSVEKGNFPMR